MHSDWNLMKSHSSTTRSAIAPYPTNVRFDSIGNNIVRFGKNPTFSERVYLYNFFAIMLYSDRKSIRDEIYSPNENKNQAYGINARSNPNPISIYKWITSIKLFEYFSPNGFAHICYSESFENSSEKFKWNW